MNTKDQNRSLRTLIVGLEEFVSDDEEECAKRLLRLEQVCDLEPLLSLTGNEILLALINEEIKNKS